MEKKNPENNYHIDTGFVYVLYGKKADKERAPFHVFTASFDIPY